MDTAFYVGNTFFQYISVVDMYMADNRIFFFIHFDNAVE